MKKIALLSAAAALMLATPAMAQSGYADVTFQDEEFGGTDNEAYSVGGALALGDHVQLDARYASLDNDFSTVESWNVGGHFFNRGPQWLWGGYVGYTDFDSTTEWTAAGESQFYMERTTLSGSLSYTDVDGGDLELWALDGEVRHFVSDNFSLQANLGYGTADVGAGFDVLSAGVGGEFQLASVPISFYGGYQHTEISDGGPEGETLGVGVRWNFGGGSLIERNRQGAGLGRPQGYFNRIYAMNPR